MKSFHNATPEGPTKTKTDVWITPPWIIEGFGADYFDLDPCAHLPNGEPIVKTAKHYYTKEQDGLKQDWFGNVFVNFPYSQAREWLAKCADEYAKGNARNIVVLCFVRSETKAWQDYVKYATGINLLAKRIKFLDSSGIEKGNGNAPSCLIAFGNDAYYKLFNFKGIVVGVK